MGTKATASKFSRGAGTALFGVAGVALGIGFRVLGKVRQNRPVHSVGTVVPGMLVIPAPGAVGTGLALRIPCAGTSSTDADLLFASTAPEESRGTCSSSAGGPPPDR